MGSTTTLARAREVAALFKGALLIYDPSIDIPGGFPGSGVFDEFFEMTYFTVDPALAGDTTEAFMIIGRVPQISLGLPPGLDMKGSGTKYILDSDLEYAFKENVGALDAQHALLKSKQAAGHPLGNRGIRSGDHLIPFGDDGHNAELIWSSSADPRHQKSSMYAD